MDMIPDEMDLVDPVYPNLLEESILFDRAKNSRINRTDVLLPRGNPNGKNVLVTLLCKDAQTTVDRLKSGKVLKVPPQYRYFVKPVVYTKKVFAVTRRFVTNRAQMRDFCIKNGFIWTPQLTSNFNTVSEISSEINLYMQRAEHRSVNQVVNEFLPYLDSCIYQMPKSPTQRNIIVIDALDYLFTRTMTLVELKTNPAYLIYRIAHNEPSLLTKRNYEFVFMGLKTSMIFSPAGMTDKEMKQFFVNLFIFMNTNIAAVKAAENKMLSQSDEEEKKDPIPDVPKKDGMIVSPYQTAVKFDDNPAGQMDQSEPTAPVATAVSPKIALTSIDDSDTVDAPETKPSLFVVDDEPATEADPDDEVFIPFSDDDPFGYDTTKEPARAKTARVRSKLILPDSPKQQELLRNQAKIVIRGEKTIQQEMDIIPGNIEVPTTSHETEMRSHNTDVTQSRYENYRKTYMREGFDSDMIKAFTSLNAKENAFYIKDVKILDHSDSMNYMELWEVTVVDQYGTQSTIKLDIPKMYDNKYLYIAGNLKTLENQNVPLPIIKTGPNRVIITTNYNKIFMERYDTKSTTTVTKLAKVISYDSDHRYFVTGNNRIDNMSYDIPLEMSEIAKMVTQFKGTHARIYFNMKLPIMVRNNPDPMASTVWVGTMSGKDVYMDKKSGRTEDGLTFIDIILKNLPDEYVDVYNSVKTRTNNMYARMKMNMKNVPCLYIIAYWIGLQEVLTKSGAKYRFVPDENRAKPGSHSGEIRVQFADGALYYEETEYGELLLNPLLKLNTRQIMFNDMSHSETWENILVGIYGSYRSLNVIKAFHEWMIDWITLEILQMYKLPETISELIMYGIKMLTNNQYTLEISDGLQRMRHGEIIPAMVYYRLASQYAKYSATGGRTKMTLPQDAIVKDMLALTTLEDASIINPALELTKDSSISKRGFRGTNLDAAYTKALRTYSEDSIGKHAMSTATSSNVGVQKFLTHEPDIVNIRGIRDHSKPVQEMNGANVMSSVEMLIPMAVMHDDSTRVAMGVKQAGHVVATEVSSPSLISNGADEAIRFRLSSEYVVNADEDGKVIEYDDKSGMMVVQYKPFDAKPGKFRAFKLSQDVVKNSGGGIYFAKQLVSPLKVGDTFKKGDVLAYHDKFFTYSKLNGLCYNIGPLVRCVLHATSEAYEDGGWLTESAAKDMATSIVYKEDAQLDRNATVADILKIGDLVHVDDKLISFSSGTSDAQLNKLLSILDDDTTSDLQRGKRAEHAGTIVDIIIYSQVDPNDCSPSVKKLLTDYRTRIQRVSNVLDKYDKSDGIVKAGYMNRQPDTSVHDRYGKIKGIETDILIEFYIKHTYNISIGDKIVLYSANKNTISKVVPDDQAGWSEDNPDDPIQGAISPSPLSKRMIFSPQIMLSNTTCLMELKRKILQIWDE